MSNYNGFVKELNKFQNYETEKITHSNEERPASERDIQKRDKKYKHHIFAQVYRRRA